jgi:hypothetical protein
MLSASKDCVTESSQQPWERGIIIPSWAKQTEA